jgi:hypothetical protein
MVYALATEGHVRHCLVSCWKLQPLLTQLWPCLRAAAAAECAGGGTREPPGTGQWLSANGAQVRPCMPVAVVMQPYVP